MNMFLNLQKYLFFILATSVSAHGMEQNETNYFEMLPSEIIHHVIKHRVKQISAPNFAQTITQIEPLSRVNKQLKEIAQEHMNALREQGAKSNGLLKEQVDNERLLNLLIQHNRFMHDNELLTEIEKFTLEWKQHDPNSNEKNEIRSFFRVLKNLNHTKALTDFITNNEEWANDFFARNLGALQFFVCLTTPSSELREKMIDDIITLLECKINPNQMLISDGSRQFAFHYACSYGNLALVKKFITSGVAINATNDNKTALEWMTCDVFVNLMQIEEKQEIIEELIKAGAILNQSSKPKKTILDRAGHKLKEFLRSQGAKTYQELKDEGLV
ncbi:MAG: ankyrin repeat domain-containing protein [Candidatus Dependentiae bacterium]